MKSQAILISYILGSIDRIDQYLGDLAKEDFLNNFLIQDAVFRNLEIIGEASKKIDPGLKTKNAHIPWKKITGMRNKLIHEYFYIDIEVVWVVAKVDLPELKNQLLEILTELD